MPRTLSKIKTAFSVPTTPQSRGMRAFLWDGFFMGSLETIVLQYLPLFAFAYGATNGQIGLLAAAASLGAATASFPGAWLSTKWRYRMPFVLLTRSGLAHLFLLPLALLPLFVGEPLIVGLIIAAVTMRSFMMYLGEGAWTSLAADLVPAELRGRFFGTRNLLVGLGGLAGIAAVALLLAGLGPGSEWSAVWFVAVGLGVASSVIYSRIPERDLPERTYRTSANGGWAGIVQNRNFLRYGATVMLWNLSLYMSVPFFNVHLVKNLDASPLWVGLLLLIGAAAGLLGQAAFGRMVDRKGARRLIVVSGMAVSTLPIMWFFVTSPWQVIPINIIGGVVWSAYLLANFSLLLTLSPAGQERYYAAAYTTLMFFAMTLGPVFGGALANAYGIKWTFIASGAGRFAAAWLFAIWVREEKFEPPEPTPPEPEIELIPEGRTAPVEAPVPAAAVAAAR